MLESSIMIAGFEGKIQISQRVSCKIPSEGLRSPENAWRNDVWNERSN